MKAAAASLLTAFIWLVSTTNGSAQEVAAPPDDGGVATIDAGRLRHAFEQHRRRWLDPDLLEAVYEARQWRPIFVGDTALTTEGELLAARVDDFDAHGIDPDWLGLDRVVREHEHWTSAAPGADRADEGASLELARADTIVRYATELRYGNAANMSETELDRLAWSRTELSELLGLQGVEFDRALYLLPPTLPAYVNLQESLAEYRRIQTQGGFTPIDALLDETASGDAVIALRRRLEVENYLGDVVTSTWTADLSAAVERFQEAHHIEPDGRVNEQTLTELNVPVEQRIASVIVSLDHLRDSARGVDGHGDAVWVNVAGFYTEVWEDDVLLYRTRSVVGRTSGGGQNQTPLFSDQMERIDLNPVWYIPPRLARNMSPDASRGIVRQDGRLVQLPGPDNALGRVKFLFPNTHSVYLHDTNHRDLFANTVRAFSSGCVRIERPLELAALLVSRDQGRDIDETSQWVDAVMQSNETEIVNLTTPLPVHLEYYTAYVADDGITEFYGDIYNRDRREVREIARRRDVTWDHGGEQTTDTADGG